MQTLQDLMELENNPTVFATCCGRKVSADQLVNVASYASAFGGSPLACPGCRQRAISLGLISEGELAGRARG